MRGREMAPSKPSKSVIAGIVSVALLSISASEPILAAVEEQSRIPDFSQNGATGWDVHGGMWQPPDSGPGPTRLDPAHPYVGNLDAKPGQQVTPRIGDPDSPIL